MNQTPTTYSGLIAMIIDFINVLIPAMFALLFLFFIWKMIDSWILHAGDPAKVQEGKMFAVTAILVLVVAISVWGIVALIRTSFFAGY